ncbi:HMG box domain-containing protein [Mycena indigotica]|uniref:HMG box domain-containing protein n=1 Tax=Mycena indigotica TaxID=2126181 RepID=A0A8H6SCA4_9AGAR|nr:HMG box domain-containing protein [Mycena indigotica]KAF7296803.1 HMG box domain-containing protein [Mycena indigotica]
MPAVRVRQAHPAARPHLLDLSSTTSSLDSVSTQDVKASLDRPALTIVAPTPRQSTFTFVPHPLSHPLPTPSPTPSPAALGIPLPLPTTPVLTPVEGLRQLSLSSPSPAATSPSPVSSDSHVPTTPPARPIPSPLPLSAYTRTLTPVYVPAATPSPAPSASRSKRRGVSADGRPRKGDADYVKRPENAFILFRRQACAERASSPDSVPPASSADGAIVPARIALPGLPAKARQADLSKAISAQWRALGAEERQKWEALAAEKKKEHEEKHPGYVYRPRRKAPKEDGLVVGGPSDPEVAQQEYRLAIPNVYGPSGSFHTHTYTQPTRGQEYSLLPMIMSSASHRESTNLGGFDYLPAAAENAAMSSFDANLMASDFLRSMFASSSHLIPPPTFTDTADRSPASSPEPELATPGATSSLPPPTSAPLSCDFPTDPSTWYPPPSSALLIPSSSSSSNNSFYASNPWAAGAQQQYAALSLSSDGVAVAQPDTGFSLDAFSSVFDQPMAEFDFDAAGGVPMGLGIGLDAPWDGGWGDSEPLISMEMGVDPMELHADI